MPAFSDRKQRFRNHSTVTADPALYAVRSGLNETGRSEAADYPGVGPMGPDAAHRFRWGDRPGFAEILSGAAGCAIPAAGFSNEGPGQVASRPRLAAPRAAPQIGFVRTDFVPASPDSQSGKRENPPLDRRDIDLIEMGLAIRRRVDT